MTKKTDKPESLSAFAKRAGISVSYACQLVNKTGNKSPTIEKCAEIYRRTGQKFGALAYADTREANTIVKVLERAGLLAA
jgi:transcriptional regulator with XRE-family HTH domain